MEHLPVYHINILSDHNLVSLLIKWAKYKYIVSITGYLEHFPLHTGAKDKFISDHNCIPGSPPILYVGVK